MNGNITSSLGSNLIPEITLLFVGLTLIGIIIFITYIARVAFGSDYEPFEREQTPEEQKQLFVEAKESILGKEVDAWNCKNCGATNRHEICEYCGKANE
jgi:hypothetical protein